MAIAITPSDTGAQIRIDGEFNIYTAAESRDLLLDALNAHPAVAVDVEAVEEIDTSGIQLLLMLQKEAARTHKAFSLSALSPAIQEVATLLNLTELNGASAAETPA
jgi:anti-anti-sigma factor